jgi:hypothetical protein
MDASEIEAVFGQTEDAPGLAKLLQDLGVSQRPKVVDDVAELLFKDLGLRLAFMPEGPKSSKLKLTSIIFHSGSEVGYQPFAGALPRGLSFSDDKDAVRAKLGTPTKSIDRYHIDHWISPDRRLSITYKPADNKIATINIGMPT